EWLKIELIGRVALIEVLQDLARESPGGSSAHVNVWTRGTLVRIVLAGLLLAGFDELALAGLERELRRDTAVRGFDDNGAVARHRAAPDVPQPRCLAGGDIEYHPLCDILVPLVAQRELFARLLGINVDDVDAGDRRRIVTAVVLRRELLRGQRGTERGDR